ncbi:sulfur carrier protein ThiS [Tamlana sp. 2_MG-2023]|uniref:sulfur carrier protein ThiS n=1 Tax=unclassified Tamlana TaxID=2614803 RepID=UPI0026E1234C|nr:MULTISPECIES: sulfur carrier protein ThiS [unclassified Tamlana]MDO6759700.1 sulfur carrier protein ThiS [Tamlana sp. 2_MG-2023]MDO6791323.1 sulfur carrier protein ThiS [Tamlana sp. 1_MG-2023]
MIKIRVNENIMEVTKDFNILQLLEQLNTPKNGIAVAINSAIISKEVWATQHFSENDNILIIQATQGG